MVRKNKTLIDAIIAITHDRKNAERSMMLYRVRVLSNAQPPRWSAAVKISTRNVATAIDEIPDDISPGH